MKFKVLSIAALAFIVYACGGSKAQDSENKESDPKDEKENTEKPVAVVKGGAVNIAYVNIDSLNTQYQRITDANLEAQSMMEEAQTKLQNLEKRFQAAYNDVQKKYATMLKSEQDAATRRLENMQTNLQKEQQAYQNKLMEFEQNVATSNYETLYEFAAKYAKENGYDLVLSKKFAGELLYANEAFDITEQVIEGLNAQYKASLSDTL